MAVVLVLGACSPDASTPQADPGEEVPADPTPGDHAVRVGVLAEPNSMDPHDHFRGNWNVRANVYETLLQYDEDLEPVGVLAVSWSFSDDNSAMTVEIRPDVAFHSGAPVTAEAVAANLEKAKEPETGHGTASRLEFLESAAALDPTSVLLTFSQPVSDRIAFDMLDSVHIVDPDFFELLDSQASGTGPFELEDWRPGQRFDLKRNEAYWGEPATPARIEFTLFDDSDARLAALQTGELDVAWDIGSPRELERLGDGFEAIPEAPICTVEFAMNVRRAPFDNEAVRRALQYAVDREGIAQSVFAGFSEPRVLPWVPESLAYDGAALNDYPYDLDRARTLLEDVGDVPLAAELLIFDIVPWFPDVGQVLQASFAEIGFDLELTVLPIAEAGPRVIEEPDFDVFFNYVCDMHLYPTTAAGDLTIGPANNVRLFDQDSAVAAEWTSAREQMGAAVDEAELAAAAEEMNRVLLERSWVLFITSAPLLHAVRSEVSGLEFSAGAHPLYANVAIAGG